ncbi:hypothetical protein [Terriglobus albidus]|uniref:hypothetical protein n=1 Tax=Terriglobus albidus TaxID=1592106 RepID=UPI0021DF74C4|nr:hypothetical protein [Terriglobus albidus]
MAEIQEQAGKPEVQEGGIARVNDELSLGYDRDFEKQWWRIEVGLWSFLTVILLLGVMGLLGRGPMAHKTIGSADGALTVDFQRITRYKTPEAMTIRLDPKLYRNGRAYVWLNRAIVERMGLQRIIPQPALSIPGEDGIGYLFPISDPAKPTLIYLAKEPAAPGLYEEEVKTDPEHDIFMRALILP